MLWIKIMLRYRKYLSGDSNPKALGVQLIIFKKKAHGPDGAVPPRASLTEQPRPRRDDRRAFHPSTGWLKGRWQWFPKKRLDVFLGVQPQTNLVDLLIFFTIWGGGGGGVFMHGADWILIVCPSGDDWHCSCSIEEMLPPFRKTCCAWYQFVKFCVWWLLHQP